MRGFEVLLARRVEDVVPLVRAERPDLVLQDCHMPGLDLGGLVPSVRAAAAPRRVHVLLFTASVAGDEFWRAVGADGLVRKPFDADHLERAIRGLVAPTGGSGPETG